MFHAEVRVEGEEKTVRWRLAGDAKSKKKNWITIVVTVLKIFKAINNFMKVKKLLFDSKLLDYRLLISVSVFFLKILKEIKKNTNCLIREEKLKSSEIKKSMKRYYRRSAFKVPLPA